MFTGIAAFELRYQIRNPVFWVAAAVFFLLGFGLTASEDVSIGTPGAINENSPYAIMIATNIFSVFYLFVITAFVANAIVRDDASGFAPIVRATHVTKRQIVLGRFVGGFIAALAGFVALHVGMACGTLMPWVDPETIGPFRISHYSWHFLIIALPNLFLLSALLFALATIFRSMLASYTGAIAIVIGFLLAQGPLSRNLETRKTFALWEPLGTGALREATRYWTQAEMNTRLVDLTGLLLFNRLWAIALGLALLAFTLWRFSMTERSPSLWRLRQLQKREARDRAAAAVAPAAGGGAVVARNSAPSKPAQFVSRLRVELRQALTSPGLLILALLACAFTAINLWQGGSAYGTADYPTAARVVKTVGDMSSAFLLMIAVFYGGELVWRERDHKLNELIDSTPVAGWIMTLPKIIAIFVILVAVNLVAALTGLTYQIVEGPSEFGLGLYLTAFLLPNSIDMLLISVMAIVVQVLSPNKYVGWGVIFLWFLFTMFLTNMGFSNPLYIFPNTPSVPLSDFVGAGSFWWGAAVLRAYWIGFAVLLAVVGYLLWPRGTDLGLRTRARRLRWQGNAVPFTIAGVALTAMGVTGAYAYHNIKVLNRYETPDDLEAMLAGFERQYLKYEKLPQPSVDRVVLDIRLYPGERRMVTSGRYALINKTAQSISDVHIRSDRDTDFVTLTVQGARLVSDDKRYGYRIYRFAQPLLPGQRSQLDFKSDVWRRGFAAFQPATDILENGTFINNFSFAPRIGMTREMLLSDRTKRRRQGLPAELRAAKLEDLTATQRNYVGADWVMSDIRLTTDAGQTPVAPGNKISDTIANGRRTARFVSHAPILNFFSVQSANYKLARTVDRGVELTVLYHPGHDRNVPKMLKAMAAALDYYRANFGPYQFNYARIIEFPGYDSFAQAFAGTMPYSESLGFNANTSDPEKIDFTSYVVAHEIAHQYWAHQVVGADMEGKTMSSETLAQYSALMVMKQLYGVDQIRRFLKYELDNYLNGRKSEAVEERPLIRVSDQGYIHYRKGAVVMFHLQEELGEDAVNRALRRFVAKYRFTGPPYLRSVDLVAELRREARTPAQQQLITDLFERITLYDLKVTDAVTRKIAGGWETRLAIAAEKYVANGKGADRALPMSEPIEIGLFTQRPGLGSFASRNVVFQGKRTIRAGANTLVLRTKSKPLFAGVDPYNFRIDRASDDNVLNVRTSDQIFR